MPWVACCCDMQLNCKRETGADHLVTLRAAERLNVCMDRFVQEMHKLQITEVVMIKSGAPVGLKCINELKYVDWL